MGRGHDEHGSSVTKAADYAARANAGHRANFNMTSHNITNHLCTIEGNTAYCESYVVGGLFWLDGKTTTIAFGRYLDQLEKRNGEWRILTRRCTIEMTADTDATWVYSKNVKGFLKALWNKDDPSYERPSLRRPMAYAGETDTRSKSDLAMSRREVLAASVAYATLAVMFLGFTKAACL